MKTSPSVRLDRGLDRPATEWGCRSELLATLDPAVPSGVLPKSPSVTARRSGDTRYALAELADWPPFADSAFHRLSDVLDLGNEVVVGDARTASSSALAQRYHFSAV